MSNDAIDLSKYADFINYEAEYLRMLAADVAENGESPADLWDSCLADEAAKSVAFEFAEEFACEAEWSPAQNALHDALVAAVRAAVCA